MSFGALILSVLKDVFEKDFGHRPKLFELEFCKFGQQTTHCVNVRRGVRDEKVYLANILKHDDETLAKYGLGQGALLLANFDESVDLSTEAFRVCTHKEHDTENWDPGRYSASWYDYIPPGKLKAKAKKKKKKKRRRQ